MRGKSLFKMVANSINISHWIDKENNLKPKIVQYLTSTTFILHSSCILLYVEIFCEGVKRNGNCCVLCIERKPKHELSASCKQSDHNKHMKSYTCYMLIVYLQSTTYAIGWASFILLKIIRMIPWRKKLHIKFYSGKESLA